MDWRVVYFREASGRSPVEAFIDGLAMEEKIETWSGSTCYDLNEAISREVALMDDFQKQMSRLRRNPVFAAAFDKRRTEAEVAFQIRRFREAKGWTQRDLAKKVGCSQQAVSAIEQAGYKRHSLPLLRRIAAVLDADVVVALVPRRAA